MMNKLFIGLFLLANIQYCGGQALTFDGFEQQVLEYQPNSKNGASAADVGHTTRILEEVKSRTKNDPSNFDVVDYFNVLSAFLTLKESKGNVDLAFSKFIATEGSCDYVLMMESIVSKNDKYKPIIEAYTGHLEKCKQLEANASPEQSVEDYAAEHGLDIELLKTISLIEENDIKYRIGNQADFNEKQPALDAKNQVLIDSLFQKYGKYIGKSLVGERFEVVMWSVVQHSSPAMMEKYLPIIHAAVKAGELDVVPLKMLIDRYYGLKYGYQVFGSQVGFDFKVADENTKNGIMKQYGIN
jgi:hypothetical protein